jgi:hypothetical protein
MTRRTRCALEDCFQCDALFRASMRVQGRNRDDEADLGRLGHRSRERTRERAKYGHVVIVVVLIASTQGWRTFRLSYVSILSTCRTLSGRFHRGEVTASASQFAVSSLCCRLIFARVHHPIPTVSSVAFFLSCFYRFFSRTRSPVSSQRVSDVSIGCRRMRLAYIRVMSFSMMA